MAIKWDNIEQSRQIGSSGQGNGMAARRQQDMATMGRMLELASKTDPQTLLGYGLGKLIRGAIDHRQRVRQEEQSLGYDAGMLDRAGALNSQIQDIDSQISGLQQPQPSPVQDVGQGLPTMQEAFSGYAYANANNGNSMEAALARRGAPADVQFFSMPQDGKQTADMAMRDGLQQEQRENKINQLSQKRAQAQQELEQLQSSYMGAARQDALAGQTRLVTGLLGQIGEAKQLYDTAKSQGNEEGMAMAQQASNQAIEQARGMGIDISNAANMSLQDIKQAMAQADMSLLSNSLTPDEYARQRYLQYRYGGMGHTQAREMAGHDAAQYQADMLGRNQSAFFTYGMDNNGAITPAGIQMLAKMAQYGGQDVANVYANMLAGPKDAYKFGNQRQLAADAHAYKMEQQHDSQDYDWNKTQAGYRHAERMEALKVQLQEAGKNADRAQRLEMLKAAGIDQNTPEGLTFIETGKFPTGKGSSKGGGKGESGGLTVAQAMDIIGKRDKYAEDHPGEYNPYDAWGNEAENVLNKATKVPTDEFYQNEDGTIGYNLDAIIHNWTEGLEKEYTNKINGKEYRTKGDIIKAIDRNYGGITTEDGQPLSTWLLNLEGVQNYLKLLE